MRADSCVPASFPVTSKHADAREHRCLSGAPKNTRRALQVEARAPWLLVGKCVLIALTSELERIQLSPVKGSLAVLKGREQTGFGATGDFLA